MKEKKYTIEELSELTGFTRRTIRYYIQEGLLDPPAGRGRGGFYYDSHLNKLMHIKALQGEGLRLAAITQLLGSEQSDHKQHAAQVWTKYEIAQGIEINVLNDKENISVSKINKILNTVKEILKENDDDK